MGSLLLEHGLEPGECPELLNVEQPDVITGIHRAYVTAGADIILTNTFGGTSPRLGHYGVEARARELNSVGAALARRVADGASRPVAVAGSVGPTGQLFAPLGPLEPQTARGFFREQVEALADAGVDVVWIETMSSVEELGAAHEAAAATGLPVVATMSFDTRGHTMMGVRPGQLATWAAGEADRPVAIGANCGIGTEDVVEAVREMRDTAGDVTLVAKANCGLPVVMPDATVFPEQPEDMPGYVDAAIRAGARIIGACCGSRPDHIAAIRAAVERHES